MVSEDVGDGDLVGKDSGAELPQAESRYRRQKRREMNSVREEERSMHGG